MICPICKKRELEEKPSVITVYGQTLGDPTAKLWTCPECKRLFFKMVNGETNL
jgi:uncharacterized protein with PIN domain